MSKLYSFDQLIDSKELLERKPPRFIAGLIVFLLMSLFVFLIWAYVSKIDIVSKGTAMIQGKSDVSVSRTQIVGVIDTVAVKPGDEVKKGNILIQLKNQELTDKQSQMNQIVEHLEKQKGMLEQLKESIQSHKSSFLDDVDKKIREEYQAYDQRYQSIQNEKDNEIKTIENSKISSEQDEVLQGLIAENENIQREIDIIEKQKTKENILEEQKQVIDDKKGNLESQKNSVEKRIQQRKETLEHERTKVDVTKEGKQVQKKDALKQYKEESIISVNQHIQSLEQELFIKKQELDGLRHQNETTIIKAEKTGLYNFLPSYNKGI